jgi:hypothetical protein
MAVNALDDLGTGDLILPDHLPQVFRIKLTGEHGGVHEVAEHNGELAAFRLGRMWDVDSRGGRSVLNRRRRGRGGVPRHQRRGAGSRGHGRGTRPHQDTARLVHRQLLPIQEFVL